jgi:hypothetical protein
VPLALNIAHHNASRSERSSAGEEGVARRSASEVYPKSSEEPQGTNHVHRRAADDDRSTVSTGGANRDRKGDDHTFAVSCWSAGSSWTNKSCTCFPGGFPDLPNPTTSNSNPTIRVLSTKKGEWTAAGIDAFLLKIVIEERMGEWRCAPDCPLTAPSLFSCARNAACCWAPVQGEDDDGHTRTHARAHA